jgi:hypothetical protein
MAMFKAARWAARNWGMTLAGVWFIIWGVAPLLKGLELPALVLPLLAIVAGVLILLQK